MKFKYIRHIRGRFQLRTIQADDEEEAWDIIAGHRNPYEMGVLIPVKEWRRLIQSDRQQA